MGDRDDDAGGMPLPRLDRTLRALEQAGLRVSAVAVAALGLLVIASISGRALFGRSIPDDNVMVGDLMVAIVALSWAAVTATRGHIAVEVFTNWVRPRLRAGLDALGSLVGLAMILPLSWASWNMLEHALARGTYYDGLLSMPQWPARMLFFYAFALMTCRLLLLLARDVGVALRSSQEAR
jgi:TRAP-type C4-dicarboxylate transport system permease small subunit